VEALGADAIDAVAVALDPEIVHLLEACSAFVLLLRRGHEDHKIRRRDDGRRQCVQFLVFGLELFGANQDIVETSELGIEIGQICGSPVGCETHELGLEIDNLRLLHANSSSEDAVPDGFLEVPFRLLLVHYFGFFELAPEITVFDRGKVEHPDGS